MNGPPFSRHPTNRRAGGATPPLCFPSYSAYPVAPMAYTDVAGDTVQVVQEKTDQAESDEKLVIPMHPALRRESRPASEEACRHRRDRMGRAFHG
jgi:hypothetical protein